MGSSSFTAWLLIRDIEREVWADTAGPSTIATLEGQLLEDIYAPGLLFSFPTVAKAARAALRIHPTLARAFSQGGAPPMVVDVGGDIKKVATVSADMRTDTILTTDEGARLLAGEPIELFPGPEVQLDGGSQLKTKYLRLSSHNLGWAAPTLETSHPFSNQYLRRSEPNVVNIQIDSPRKKWLPRLPWKLLIMLFILAGLLLGAHQLAGSLTKAMKSASSQVSEDEFIEPITMVDEIAEDQIEFSNPTPVVPGEGTIVIHVQPQDAEVFLNDQKIIQEPPIVLENQSNQEMYYLTVQRPGFETYTNIFNIHAHQKKTIEISLVRSTTYK